MQNEIDAYKVNLEKSKNEGKDFMENSKNRYQELLKEWDSLQ